MTDHAWNLKIEDSSQKGWPFEFMSVNELELINCPSVVIPADFQARDTIAIEEGEIRVTIVFDGAVLMMINGAQIPHTVAHEMVGRPLADLVDIPQLRDHPVSAMTMDTIDVLENGVDIELRD